MSEVAKQLLKSQGSISDINEILALIDELGNETLSSICSNKHDKSSYDFFVSQFSYMEYIEENELEKQSIWSIIDTYNEQLKDIMSLDSNAEYWKKEDLYTLGTLFTKAIMDGRNNNTSIDLLLNVNYVDYKRAIEYKLEEKGNWDNHMGNLRFIPNLVIGKQINQDDTVYDVLDKLYKGSLKNYYPGYENPKEFCHRIELICRILSTITLILPYEAFRENIIDD